MTSGHLKESLKKQADELNDFLPVIRDRVEEIITADNIDYIDELIDKTYHLEGLLTNFLDVLSDENLNMSHDDLVVISYDIDMIHSYIEFIDDTSLFITREKKK